jgi:hypothetical protein
MIPIAARRAGQPAKAGMSYDPWDPPGCAEEVLECLCGLFGLPELAGLAEVLVEIAKLREMATGRVAPPAGVEIDKVVGQLRRLFNLPTMSSVDDVFAEADKLLSAVAASGSKPTNTGGGLARTPTTKEQDQMDELMKLIAGKLGVPVTAEATKEAVILALDKGKDATAKLTQILSALGVQDVDAGVAKLAGMFQQVKALEDAMPELASLYETKTDDEEKDAKDDVDSALAAHRIPEEAREALMFMRTGGVTLRRLAAGEALALLRDKGEAKKLADALTARRVARAKFLERYPRSTEPPSQHAHLTQTYFAASSEAQHSSALRGVQLDANGRVARPSSPAHPAPAPGQGRIDLSRYPGENRVLKAKAYILENGGKGLSYDELMAQASALAAANAA